MSRRGQTRAVAAVVLVALSGCATGITLSSSSMRVRDAKELVTLEADAIVVRERITFPHGSAELDRECLDLLDVVADIMQRTAAITKLTIEGHTDTTGVAELNQPLSEARALEVKRYLEKKGVAAERLESRGFGASQPVDSNDTEAGRARNRRVEFKVTR